MRRKPVPVLPARRPTAAREMAGPSKDAAQVTAEEMQGEDEFEPEADVLPDEPEDALVVLELGRPVDDVPEEVFPLEDDEPPVAVLDGDEEDEVEVRVVAA